MIENSDICKHPKIWVQKGDMTLNRFLIGSWILVLVAIVSWISRGYAQFYNAEPQQNVLIILDASDSMNEFLEGRPKIQLAKEVVMHTLHTLPPNVNVGLRVYGHKLGTGGFITHNAFGGVFYEGDACRQYELLVPIQPNNRFMLVSQVAGIRAVGKTPISYSLEQAVHHDLANIRGPKSIILVSDGRETCDGDPCDLAVNIVRSGLNIKISTIGLATHDRVADNQLRCIAMASRGKFYSADTSADLTKSLQDSTQVQTSIQGKISPSP